MTTLYDYSPLLRMMAVGTLLALLPLAWIWWRTRGQPPAGKVYALTMLTLFLSFDLVVFGAFTRLTDSGLGCPDWPGCYGYASPIGASTHIADAEATLPSGPVTLGKAWVEMVHRYLATSVGILILVLAAVSWWRVRDYKSVRPPAWIAWWPTLTLLWVCIQGAFGAWTVTLKLFPAIVTLHLLGGLGLLLMLMVQAEHAARVDAAGTGSALPKGLRAFLMLSLGLAFLQAALGGWVSTNYAVLACSDFPQCQGRWWPRMDFAQGFELWRDLGLTADAMPLDFAALTAIHYVHRLVAYLVLPVLGLLAWQLNRLSAWRGAARALAALVGLQLATGLSNIIFEWPLVAAVAHTAGAAALVLLLGWACTRAYSCHAGVRPPQPRGGA